ncbi:MAG: zinc ribbon domain-containing protein [Candidatus Bathyarchaeia archaeon]|jgi:hypothetical protein
MPYCENCGTQLNPNAKFCGNCGAATNKSPVNPQQPPEQFYPPSPSPPVASTIQSPPQMQPSIPSAATNSELVIGAIILKKPKSLGRWDTYTGVLTNQRLIFAQMTNEMIKAAAQQARDQAKAEGKGFFGQWTDQLKGVYGYSRRYLDMQPSAILAETPGNFALDNNTINEIKLKEKLMREDQGIYEFEVQIQSSAGKYEYIMDQNNDYVKLLKQVFGERVKTPFGYVSKTINIRF